MPGGAGMGGMDPAQMQAMQQAAMANASVGARGNSAAMANAYASAGYSQDDIDALTAFQQEMMQLSMAASSGDARAKATAGGVAGAGDEVSAGDAEALRRGGCRRLRRPCSGSSACSSTSSRSGTPAASHSESAKAKH
jgi:hypothetical protein